MGPLEIIAVRKPEHVATARSLFGEYAHALAVDLRFQQFDHELASLPGKYVPPSGELLIARSGEEWAGCVAARPLEEDIAEMKRLYVRPRFRGTGLGRRLAVESMAAARRSGYRKMQLDTLASMESRSRYIAPLAFEVGPYYHNRAGSFVLRSATVEPQPQRVLFGLPLVWRQLRRS